jgi:uncharacterized membrane protein HdeD (DUF308 family)
MTAAAFPTKERLTPWWVVLLEGIFAVFIGIMLLRTPLKTTLVLVQALGIYWFITGILSIVLIFVDRTGWGWKLISGILGIIAGLLVIQNPIGATVVVPVTFVLILGIVGILSGIINLIEAFQGKGWGAGILGVLSIIFGIFLVLRPAMGALSLPFVVGIFAIVGGILAIIMAFRLKD